DQCVVHGEFTEDPEAASGTACRSAPRMGDVDGRHWRGGRRLPGTAGSGRQPDAGSGVQEATMRRTVRTRVRHFDESGLTDARADALAGEEPLEVRLDGEQFTVTMRTPGDDVELIAGFLLSEGIVRDWRQILRVDFSTGIDPDGTRNLNVARVTLEPGTWDREAHRARQIYTSSACGICGTASIEAVQRTTTHPIVLDAMSEDGPVASPAVTSRALL